MKGARVLLGVCGGIAAYKMAGVASALVQAGAIVDVILTAEAERFIGPLTFAALTGRAVYTSLWDAPERIPHIRLVREAQAILVAPATANVIAKLVSGIADDLLLTALLAARVPIIVAPAMNDAMYAHAATQANIATLLARGYGIVPPESGFLAERESGIGRLAAQERLIDALQTAIARTQSLRGKRVAITAGPTREAFDPVRYVSNASTGATGIAIAREAAMRGADVTLLLGPTLLDAPTGARTFRFTTAQELLDLAMTHAADADVTIATAAVADWRPAQRFDAKVKKTSDDLTVQMVRNPDVLAELGKGKASTFLVGFAAETEAHEINAREKIEKKNLDAVVVNDVADEAGFGLVRNTLTVLWGRSGRRDLGTAEKSILAARLLDTIEELLACS
ncbi:MAG: bifunctional phosphopantothenoylcysteine decarboxylase/phosphopantothenate--cysteine ligase CoaBC [Candidatus Eremiobacteraeota bacterium]|nr:bifunctional phosphopantothenoylcysteine decarboxylase/phosphopantothenate--cysteine ligase CoaBC [Candidatus Eremiobacteraeota bacterium]